VHLSRQCLAAAMPAEAGDAVFEAPIKPRAALPDSCQGRSTAEPEEVVAHASRVMLCRVEGLTGLTHDIRELRLAIEAGGPFGFSAGRMLEGKGMARRDIHADAFHN